MTHEEAKQIFLSRGYVEVNGGIIYDADKWRESYRVISEWLEQEPLEVEAAKLQQAYNKGFEDCRQAVLNQLKCCLTGGETEYKYVKLHIDSILPVTPQPKTGHCKDCKWWKDSDGAYRRGVGAESKCPINHKEVYEGNGYCFLFEPQEGANEWKDINL